MSSSRGTSRLPSCQAWQRQGILVIASIPGELLAPGDGELLAPGDGELLDPGDGDPAHTPIPVRDSRDTCINMTDKRETAAPRFTLTEISCYEPLRPASCCKA